MVKRLEGLSIVVLESRRGQEMGRWLEREGGKVFVAPSMREVPLSDHQALFAVAKQWQRGEVDLSVFFTGVGIKLMRKALLTRYSAKEIQKMLRSAQTVARGPKPLGALKKLGVVPDLVVPEPNTWREIIEMLDRESPVRGKRVVVQEYGQSNREFLEALQKRGAKVKPIVLYRWALPEKLAPLQEAIRAIVAGRTDLLLFTSAQQCRHLILVAKQMGLKRKLLRGCQTTFIGSIGPTTTLVLTKAKLQPDYEPTKPKLNCFLNEIALRAPELLQKKREACRMEVNTLNWDRVDMVWQKPISPSRRKRVSAFLLACRQKPTPYTPVWFMRQAGRFLHEYRELRAKVPFLKLCKTPELAAEVTLMPVDRLGVDAAIVFADILLILESLGVSLSFTKGEGPAIQKPLRSAKAVAALRPFEPASLHYVYETVRLVRRALKPERALIGFAGGPFTVASYAIEGGTSRTFRQTKLLMYRQPEAWHALLTTISEATAHYLNQQIEVGADAVQLFDSWVGALSPADYSTYVLPYTRQLFRQLKKGVPAIHFGTGTAGLLKLLKRAGGSVIGLDWRVDIEEAREALGRDVAIQGNLDPLLLFAPLHLMKRETLSILRKGRLRPGYIFNLGHGLLPGTSADRVMQLVDFVHEQSVR